MQNSKTVRVSIRPSAPKTLRSYEWTWFKFDTKLDGAFLKAYLKYL